MDRLATRLNGSPAPATAPAAPRSPGRGSEPALAERFSARLRDADRTPPSGAREATPHQSQRITAQDQRDGREQGRRDGDTDAGPEVALFLPPSPTLASKGDVPAPERTAVPLSDPILDRMAAAVAELRDGATGAVRIDFPPALAERAHGAVVARDAVTGAITIQIVTGPIAMAEPRRAAMETDLRRILARRGLRARVRFDPAPSAVHSDDS